MLRGADVNRAIPAIEFLDHQPGSAVCALIALIVIGLTTSIACAQSSSARVLESLNAGWQFERQIHGSGALGSFDRDNMDGAKIEPRFAGASMPEYDDSTWETIDLPHTWNAYDVSDEEPGYWRGIGWYRRHFRVDDKFAGKRFVLEFEGVNQTANVWLNGKLLGTHKGGYTGFSFEISPRFGEDNVLTVEVNNLFDSTVPPTVKTDYSFYGGIYRSVTLLITDPTHISEMYWTTPVVSQANADVVLHSQVTNQNPRPISLNLNQEILDPDNKLVASVE